MYGMSFGGSALVQTFSFDSDISPKWGDFYSKDGTAGSTGPNKPVNTVYNAGFGNPDGTDPAVVFVAGVLQIESDHILVPDTGEDFPLNGNGGGNGAIPEPITLILSGLAVASLGGYTRDRIRAKAAAAA